MILPALLAAAPADAPAAPQPQPSQEIVVTAPHGEVRTDLAPVAVFDSGTIQATGATTIGDFLRIIRAVTQSADGSDPIFLLNGQRVSGYQEIGTLPPEAIEKVEVLPEPVALQYGYPPTRRVLNFITKRRFHQLELSATGGAATRGGSHIGTAKTGLTRLRGDGRLTVNLEQRHTDRVRQSERDIAPDPDVLFGAPGNVTAADGGLLDPALPVSAAAAPAGPGRMLDDFAPQPRLFDIGPYNALTPRNDATKVDLVLANRIGKRLSGTLSLTAERSRDRSLGGPAAGTLTVAPGNPFSPFAEPVLVQRYFTEVDPLHQRQTTTTLHAGGTLKGAVAGWQWDVTASWDRQTVAGVTERGLDLGAANAAIAAGADPFALLDPALLADRLVDHARLRTDTENAKAVATNNPVRLPAGKMTITATAEVERADAASATRGRNPFALDIGRTRTEAGLAIDVPITSKREDFGGAIGDLSANASVTARHVGGFGSLHDATVGLNWNPWERLQLQGQWKHSAAAPSLANLSNPVVSYPNATVFDLTTGRTAIVTLTTGGNADLLAERRTGRSLTANYKPFASREVRISATYEATTIRDQTGTVYALTPETEAALPDLFVHDADGALTSVAFRPTNYDRERQRTLNLTLSAQGRVGAAPPAAKEGQPPADDKRPFYWAGAGPGFRFSDRLRLRAGGPELDLIHGDTVSGSGLTRSFGYFYGGVNAAGNGINVDGWLAAPSRVRSAVPAGDLRFGTVFRLNVGASLSLHHFFPDAAWTKHLGLKLDVQNATDAHQSVRDRNGAVPNRFQPDFLDPVGRTVSLTLRKLF